MRSEIIKLFDEELTRVFSSRPEVLKFLKTHPRRNVCFDNLCEQVVACERRTYSLVFEAKQYKEVIGTVARMFAEAALTAHEQSLLSENEQRLRRATAERDQYVDEAIEHMIKDGLLVSGEATVKELDEQASAKANPSGLITET